MKNYISNELGKMGFINFNNMELRNETTPDHDWVGFEEKIKNSNLNDKELVLWILSSYASPEIRVKEIKNLKESWPEIKKISSKLIRSRVTIRINN